MIKKSALLLYCFILLGIVACKQTASENSKCKYGRPMPIFSKEMNKVREHEFLPSPDGSTEHIFLDNGTTVIITQSGCNELSQKFNMRLVDDFSKTPDDYWIDLAVKMFQYFSSMDADLGTFGLWANEIKIRKDKIKLSEPFELEAGRWVRIDKIVSERSGIIEVELSLK